MPEQISRVHVATTFALAQLGVPYVIGSKPRIGALRIEKADCSGFARAIAGITGVTEIQNPFTPTAPKLPKLPIARWNGTWAQIEWLIPVGARYALDRVGYFMYHKPQGSKYGHIALTLGRDRTIEARGKEWGICIVGRDANLARIQTGFWDGGGKMGELFEPWEGGAEDFVRFTRLLFGDPKPGMWKL